MNSLTLQLPDDLVGKMIEVIAFAIDDTRESVKDNSTKEARITTLRTN